MGTKLKPGKFDCHANALPDEPMFILLARDPQFAELVRKWAQRRTLDIQCGVCPESDYEMVEEALKCAQDGARWRKDNMNKWRLTP
jgi:hypothetical protein